MRNRGPQMDRHEAYRVLEIRPPFSEQQLKSAFRTKVKQAHPDHGGSSEQFQKVKMSFDVLFPDAGKDQVVDPVTRTVNGVPLDTLGKGLRVSAKKCYQCAGRGYTSEHAATNCEACGGYSENEHRMTFHEILQQVSRRWACLRCKGTGYSQSGAERHHVCMNCAGSGEVPSFNPVIIKNSVGYQHEHQRAQEAFRERIRDLQSYGRTARQQAEENMKRQQEAKWYDLYQQILNDKGRK